MWKLFGLFFLKILYNLKNLRCFTTLLYSAPWYFIEPVYAATLLALCLQTRNTFGGLIILTQYVLQDCSLLYKISNRAFEWTLVWFLPVLVDVLSFHLHINSDKTPKEKHPHSIRLPPPCVGADAACSTVLVFIRATFFILAWNFNVGLIKPERPVPQVLCFPFMVCGKVAFFCLCVNSGFSSSGLSHHNCGPWRGYCTSPQQTHLFWLAYHSVNI